MAEPWTQTVQRWLLAGAVAASAVVFSRQAVDNFAIWKFTLLAVAAVGIAGLGAYRIVRTATVRVPTDRFALVAGAFLLVGAATLLVSDDLSVSLIGQYKRWSGLLPYAMYVGLGLLSVRLFRTVTDLRLLLHALLAGGTLVTLYGLLQTIGTEPFYAQALDSGVSRRVFSTLGNSNFASAYMALMLPVSLWHAFDRRSPLWLRVAGALLAAGNLVVVQAAGALQGQLVTVVVLVAAAAALAVDRIPAVARWVANPRQVLLSLGALLVLGAAGAVVLWDRIVDVIGFGGVARVELWKGALAMIGDRPVLGWGFALFGNHFSEYASHSYTDTFGFTQANTTHNVPLGMFVSGGLLLGLAYLAVVVYVGRVVVQGLIRTEAETRLLVGVFGAIWLGYQLQSAVSMDEPELVVVHWVVAGAIVGFVHQSDVRTFGLPWRPAPWARGRKGARPSRMAARRARRAWAARAASTVAVLVVVLGVFPATRLLRADIAAERGTDLTAAAGNGNQTALAEAQSVLATARNLTPWEGVYWFHTAVLRERIDDTAGAYEAMEKAAERQPGKVIYTRNAARLALRLDDLDGAARWYRTGIERLPNHVGFLLEAARLFWNGLEDAATATGYVERALELEPDNDEAQKLLADIVVGDTTRGDGQDGAIENDDG